MILDLRLSREVRSARPPALTTRRRSRQQASLIYCLTSSHLGFHSSMLPLLSPCVFSSFLRSLHFSLRNSLSRVLVSMLLVRMHDMMTRHSSIHTTTTRSGSSCVRTQRRLIFIFFFSVNLTVLLFVVQHGLTTYMCGMSTTGRCCRENCRCCFRHVIL